MRKLTFLPLVISLLAACGSEPSEQERMAKRATRIERAQAAVAKPIEPRIKRVGPNELITVEVLNADRFGYIDTQRCYVWRDLEMRTASISCPHYPESQ